MHRPFSALIAAGLIAFLVAPAQAWDAHGHRLITYLALDALPFADKPARPPRGEPGDAAPPAPAAQVSMPLWLTSPAVRDACAYQAAEPDRIRAQPTPSLVHINGPDHYLDVDMLPRWGMTLETMPTLRHRFIKELTLARPKFTQNFTDYDEKKDAANENEWPGLAAQAVMESYGHLQASFRTLKIIEIVGAEGRDAQIEIAQANAVYHIGRLSHFVGDLAQPLHTTIHHHGWVRDPLKFPDPNTDPKLWNPNDYTPDYAFHAYIDGGILVHHQLTVESLMKEANPPGTPVTLRKINDMDPWQDVLEHIKRSYKQVEPLYQMHKDDSLRGPQGKALIEERLRDGASMLGAMITAAWTSSDPTKRDIDYFRSGTPPQGQPSIPETRDRQIPARTAAEFEERKAARDAAKKTGAKSEQ
jgi:hypothetical protein